MFGRYQEVFIEIDAIIIMSGRDVMYAWILFQAVAAVFKANNPGEDIKSVELSFSIRGVTFVDVQKKVCNYYKLNI